MSQDRLEAMLTAWHAYLATGSTAARDVALSIADQSRTKARGEQK